MPHTDLVEVPSVEPFSPTRLQSYTRLLVATDFCGKSSPRRPEDPIENVFAILSKRLDNLYMRPEKQNVLREEFEADVRETLQELAADGTISRICSSMPKRCERVIAQQGGPTKY